MKLRLCTLCNIRQTIENFVWTDYRNECKNCFNKRNSNIWKKNKLRQKKSIKKIVWKEKSLKKERKNKKRKYPITLYPSQHFLPEHFTWQISTWNLKVYARHLWQSTFEK